MRVFRHLHGYKPGNFNGWPGVMTINLFRDQVRRNRRYRVQELREDTVDRYAAADLELDEILASRSIDTDIRDAMSSLPAAYRKACCCATSATCHTPR